MCVQACTQTFQNMLFLKELSCIYVCFACVLMKLLTNFRILKQTQTHSYMHKQTRPNTHLHKHAYLLGLNNVVWWHHSAYLLR